MFPTYMALFKVPLTSTKQSNDIKVSCLLQAKTHLNMSLPTSTLLRPMTRNKKRKSSPVRTPFNPSTDPLANFQKVISVFTRSRLMAMHVIHLQELKFYEDLLMNTYINWTVNKFVEWKIRGYFGRVMIFLAFRCVHRTLFYLFTYVICLAKVLAMI